MSNYYTDPSDYQPVRPRKSSPLIWLLVGVAVVGLMGCGGCFLLIGYFTAVGPDTAVYTGERVPARFMKTVRSTANLEQGERILYFYSDALVDIREGFYFVSNRRVVVYVRDGEEPLTSIRFSEIEDLQLNRNESLFEDSEITLELKDGRCVWFPVSSENDHDQHFFDAIQVRCTEAEQERERFQQLYR